MAFKGILEEFDISGVFQFIQGHQQSGKLEIKTDKKHGYILFSKGNIVLVWESETSINRLIIQYMLAKGQIDQDQVRYLLDMGRKNLPRLIKAIRLNKFLDDSELNSLLQKVMMDLACSLASWESGTYEFKPTDEEVKTINKSLVLSPEFVTLEAMRRLDELGELKKGFKWDMVLQTNQEALGGRKIQVDGHVPLKHPAVHLMVLFDGQSTIYEVMRKSFLMEFSFFEVVKKLSAKNIIIEVSPEDIIRSSDESATEQSSDISTEHKDTKVSYSVLVVLVMLLAAVCIRIFLIDGISSLTIGGVKDSLSDNNAERKTGIAELQYEAESGVPLTSKGLLDNDSYYLESRDLK